MSYTFIPPSAEKEKQEVKEKLAELDETAPLTQANVNAIEKRIADKQRVPEFKDLQVQIFKSHGFIVIQYHEPPYYMTLTKRQAKEFARLLVKESL